MSSAPIQTPPQAIEAERAVLGSMLIERDAVEKALDVLAEADFYQESHRRIFRAMSELVKRGQAVDHTTVIEELRRLKSLEEAGGADHVVSLTHAVGTAAHVEHYARTVKEKSILRDLIRVSTEVVGECYHEAKDPSQILDEAQSKILKVAERRGLGEIISMKVLAQEVIDQLEQAHKNKKRVTGISTGLRDFDEDTTGFQKGDLILLAARPGQGKTALALNIAMNAVLDKKNPIPILFFSLEMNRYTLMERLVAAWASVDLKDIRTGYFPKDKWRDITTCLAKIQDSDLAIVDTPNLSLSSIRSIARRKDAELKRQGKSLGVIMIDYLQIMQAPRAESRQQAVSEISRGLKFLARDLNVPVVALSQLNRRAEEKGRSDDKPKLSDLRESGALEQDADLVTLIYREAAYRQNDPSVDDETKAKAELIIAKNRQGPTGMVLVSYQARFTRFGNYTKDAGAGPEATLEEAQEHFA